VNTSPTRRALLKARAGQTATPAGKAPLLFASTTTIHNTTGQQAGNAPAAKAQATSHVVLNLEFTDTKQRQNFKHPKLAEISGFDRFMDGFVELGAADGVLADLQKDAGVVWVDIATLVSVPPQPQPQKVIVLAPGPEEIARGGAGQLRHLTGKGVIIALVDTGLNFRSPPFVRYPNGDRNRPESRLLYLWDTTVAARPNGEQPPVKHPDGTPIGAIYDRDELTAELRQPGGILPAPDTNGHGTACAGIAAGNGNLGPEFAGGVAPEADLIAVRVGGGGPTLSNAYLLNAITQWVDQKAGEKPAIISCSFGAQVFGRNGSCVEERRLDRFVSTHSKGRAVCVAAGNEGEGRVHATVLVGPQQNEELRWDGNGQCLIEVYAGGAGLHDIGVQPPAGFNLGQFQIERYWHALSKSLVLEIRPPAGAGSLTLTPAAHAKGRIEGHAYIRWLSGNPVAFHPTSASNSHQVGCPGMAGEVITVGSYDFNDRFVRNPGKPPETLKFGLNPIVIGRLSVYSNAGLIGPNTKPDVVAPGQFFTAPAIGGLPPAEVDATGTIRPFNGTSAATPYVAGVVALRMQQNPAVTAHEIKDQLRKAAKFTPTTMKLPPPNEEWGHGKLNLDAVHDFLLGK
jgi:subtilisin family serine protease